MALALSVKQRELRKKLDQLEIETRGENLLRRKDINELYTVTEMIEERVNSTSTMEDTNDDMTGMTHMSTGAVHVTEQRIVKVLEAFVRLRQRMRDEKRRRKASSCSSPCSSGST